MGAYVQGRQGQLYDVTTGRLVGFLDQYGREQANLNLTPSIPGFRVFSTGDSFSNLAVSLAANQVIQTDQSVLMMAGRLSKNRIFEMANAGIGGQTTTQVLARFASDILQNAAGFPDAVHVVCGVNDCYVASGTITIAQSVANVLAMYQIAAANGIRFIFEIQQPPGNTLLVYPTWSAARWADQARFREGILDLQRKYPGMIVLDTYALAVNPTSATGDIASATYSYNNGGVDIGIHPSNVLTYLRGKQLAALLTNLIPTFPESCVSVADNWTTSATASNLFSNAMFATATGGAVSGTVTGTAPTGVTITSIAGAPACVASTSARADGRGNDISLAITAGAANDSIRITLTDLIARLVVGETTWVEFEVAVTGALAGKFRNAVAYWTFNVSGGVAQTTRSGSSLVPALSSPLPEDAVFSVRTYPITAQSGTFSGTAIPTLDIQFQAAGAACTVKVGLPKVRRLNA